MQLMALGCWPGSRESKVFSPYPAHQPGMFVFGRDELDSQACVVAYATELGFVLIASLGDE